jgi:SAM-dependent methyltransferase
MATSETSKYRHITEPYCTGVGVDIGSSGDPVVPHAIQIDLDTPYCPLIGPGPIHIWGDGSKLRWFAHESLDFVYSSHLIEDFTAIEQQLVLREWSFPLKPGGYLIILAPEFGRWWKAVAAGQPPNDAHKHELLEGELTQRIEINCPGVFEVIMDKCPDPNDYGLVFIARKKKP